MSAGPREATRSRATSETTISLRLRLDGTGETEVVTGIPFLDHMLRAFAVHARFDLALQAKGDLDVDAHHTVEDVAIALGEALEAALGDRGGIRRFGDAVVPLDESRSMVAVDCGGRGYAVIDLPAGEAVAPAVSSALVQHFLETLALRGGLTLHVAAQGRDHHHLTEATFKALGLALRQAVRVDPTLSGRIASTKGSR